MPLDRRGTKNELRDQLLALADGCGQPLSRSRANKLADKFKRGIYDPDLARVASYRDPTGEIAVNNVLRQQKSGPGTLSPNISSEAANPTPIKEKGLVMSTFKSTQNATTPAPHPTWCHPDHCIEDADDSICHFSAPGKFARDDYELTVVLGRGNDESTHGVELELKAGIITVTSLRQMLGDLQFVESKLEELDRSVQ